VYFGVMKYFKIDCDDDCTTVNLPKVVNCVRDTEWIAQSVGSHRKAGRM
jgi:hypothetical protein